MFVPCVGVHCIEILKLKKIVSIPYRDATFMTIDGENKTSKYFDIES